MLQQYPHGIFALFTVMLCASQTPAEGVKWRHNYADALKESAETGKPILLDFGTDNCVYCRKLDATTFRDPRIVAMLNERFIPLKIDAHKEPRLTEAVAVESFPTLILASPEGKLLGRHIGYADVSKMTALLNKAPAPTNRIVSLPQNEAQSHLKTQNAELAKIQSKLAVLYIDIVTELNR